MRNNTLTLLSLLVLLRADVVMSTSSNQTSWVITKLSTILLVHAVEGVLTDNLLRLYRGDGDVTDSTETGPTLVRSMGGNVQHTTVIFPVSGRSRKVFDFSSSMNGLSSSAAAGLPAGANDRTMLGWVKFRDLGGSTDGDPFGYGVYTHKQQFNVDAYHKWTVNLDYHGEIEGVNPIIQAVADTWYHLAISYSNSENKNIIYLNGSLLKSGVPSNRPNTNVDDAAAKFWIGATAIDPTGNRAGFKGQVADVAIFDRVLSPEDVQAVYADDNWYLTTGGGGDPHFIGFGGNYFTWQGHCDLVLIKTPKLSNEDNNLEVHIRTTRIRKWSKIDSIAIKVGKDIGEIGSNTGTLMINGSQVESFKTESMTVAKDITKLWKRIVLYKFMFSHGKVLEVKINTRVKMIYFSVSDNFPEGTVGILGSPTKPGLFARNGENTEEKNINKLAESWQVNDDDVNLFQVRRHPQYPEKCLYQVQHTTSHVNSVTRRLKKVHRVNRKEASVACVDHPQGPLQQFCIEDVYETGDLDFAKDNFYG